MNWHPFRRLAKWLVPDAKPREAAVPPPPDFQMPFYDPARQHEIDRLEREVEQAFRTNNLALISQARQTMDIVTAEARSRHMLEGLMMRMDKGQ